jgi:hypothetical protein
MREQEEMAKAAQRSNYASRGARGGWGSRVTDPVDIYQ